MSHCATSSRHFLTLLQLLKRRAVLGDAYVDNALARGVSEFARPAQEYVTENAWGNIWERPGLERKQRSLVVISLLAAGGHTKELAGHVRGGLNNGLTEVEIRCVRAAYHGRRV